MTSPPPSPTRRGGIRGKRVVVMGLGLHGGGLWAAKWLVRHGARVTVTDLKTEKELAATLKKFTARERGLIQFVLGRHRKTDFRRAQMVVQNPGVPQESVFLAVARDAGAAIENEATLFFQYCKTDNIIGVTGTRGKSSTATMVAEVMKAREHKSIKAINPSRPSANAFGVFSLAPAALGTTDDGTLPSPPSGRGGSARAGVWLVGNIRSTPMLMVVDKIKTGDWVIAELSSWQLEVMDEQKISPRIAVVTNVLIDHLNRYKNMRAYARAKESMVRYQKKEDVALLNNDNEYTRAMGKKTKARVVWFSKKQRLPRGLTLPHLPGEHQRMNARAALAVATVLGIAQTRAVCALNAVHPVPGRLERIAVKDGIAFYNDTTATTPDATMAALRALTPPRPPSKRGGILRGIVLICGGADKELDFTQLVPMLARIPKAIIWMPGTATKAMQRLLVAEASKQKMLPPMESAQSMREAVYKAQQHATRGDSVLLSPAAASFGLFVNEFDRGDQFVRAVGGSSLRVKR